MRFKVSAVKLAATLVSVQDAETDINLKLVKALVISELSVAQNGMHYNNTD